MTFTKKVWSSKWSPPTPIHLIQMSLDFCEPAYKEQFNTRIQCWMLWQWIPKAIALIDRENRAMSDECPLEP